MMTSRERVLMAFRHEIPGRVPVDYHSNAGLDLRLKKHFGLNRNDDVGLRRALGVDFWMIARERSHYYRGPNRFEDVPGRVTDEWGIRRRWIEHATGGYWDFCDFPLKDVPADRRRPGRCFMRWPD